jgi:hypothetical protein
VGKTLPCLPPMTGSGESLGWFMALVYGIGLPTLYTYYIYITMISLLQPVYPYITMISLYITNISRLLKWLIMGTNRGVSWDSPSQYFQDHGNGGCEKS